MPGPCRSVLNWSSEQRATTTNDDNQRKTFSLLRTSFSAFGLVSATLRTESGVAHPRPYHRPPDPPIPPSRPHPEPRSRRARGSSTPRLPTRTRSGHQPHVAPRADRLTPDPDRVSSGVWKQLHGREPDETKTERDQPQRHSSTSPVTSGTDVTRETEQECKLMTINDEQNNRRSGRGSVRLPRSARAADRIRRTGRLATNPLRCQGCAVLASR